MTRFSVTPLVVLALGSLAVTVPAQEQPTPALQADARRAIVAWLQCDECTEGELEAVVRLGQLAVPSLSATLRQGPPASTREAHRLHLIESFNGMQAHAKTHPESRVAMTEQQYVGRYLSNLDALYRSRAAEALSQIGGPQAEQALADATNLDVREDVRETIRRNLEALRARMRR